MKRLLLLLSIASLLSLGLTWFAQAQAPAQPAAAPAPASDRVKDEETKNGWWDCTLPGGNYTIALGKITSVSIHEYVVKSPTQTPGAVPLPARVWEVNIATDAAVVPRFYYVEAAVDGGQASIVKTGLDRLNDVANKAAERTGSVKFWQMVQKDYPLSTHAHTIEFRLESREDLGRLFGSVKRAWQTGRGAKFTINNE